MEMSDVGEYVLGKSLSITLAISFGVTVCPSAKGRMVSALDLRRGSLANAMRAAIWGKLAGCMC